eukprot:c7011_g1_i1.p1 GENE.c7011_g1_i1~~c7011_g1_i1.p1  ORF type:complete len:351 (-),score=118.95 c7011_g1_i1:52-1104(-)
MNLFVCLFGSILLITQITATNLLIQRAVSPNDKIRWNTIRMLKESTEKWSSVNETLRNATFALSEGADVVSHGLCRFIGFCQSNPATSCQAIISQPQINQARFPDGKYWLTYDPNSDYSGPPELVNCLFDDLGNGWTLLFDDSHQALVSQKISSTLVKHFKFTEVLAFTPLMIKKGLPAIKQKIYSVSDNNNTSSSGKTLDQINNNMWFGQDNWGIKNDKGQRYPNAQVHNRWKYFGQVQPNSPYRQTLYIIDDGDIQDKACNALLDYSRCGQEFFCEKKIGGGSGEMTLSGVFAQSSIPITNRGIISFGCSETDENFTRCGACRYSGPSSNLSLAYSVQSSIIQKLYAR